MCCLVLTAATNISHHVKCHLLFSRDVALAFGGAIHFGHFDITLDLSEIQSQVLSTDGHQRTTLPGSPKRCDLLKFKSTLKILQM